MISNCLIYINNFRRSHSYNLFTLLQTQYNKIDMINKLSVTIGSDHIGFMMLHAFNGNITDLQKILAIKFL